MQGSRGRRTHLGQRDDESAITASASVYGNQVVMQHERELRVREEAKKQGNLAIRIMSSKHRSKKAGNIARDQRQAFTSHPS